MSGGSVIEISFIAGLAEFFGGRFLCPALTNSSDDAVWRMAYLGLNAADVLIPTYEFERESDSIS
jgi:hypothetical protein